MHHENSTAPVPHGGHHSVGVRIAMHAGGLLFSYRTGKSGTIIPAGYQAAQFRGGDGCFHQRKRIDGRCGDPPNLPTCPDKPLYDPVARMVVMEFAELRRSLFFLDPTHCPTTTLISLSPIFIDIARFVSVGITKFLNRRSIPNSDPVVY